MDLYRNQEAAIEACYAPALRELLIAALNSDEACLSTTWPTYGSQQALHQTVYVRVSNQPLKLIQLDCSQDVQPDSGETGIV